MGTQSNNAACRQLDALRRSEQMYRGFIERSNDGVVVLQDRLIKFVNPRFCEMSGYPETTLLNTDFTNYLTAEEIAVLAERYEKRLAGEHVPPIYDTVMTRKDSTKIPLEISAAAIDYHDKPADLVLVRDITIRRQAEECLRKYGLLSDHARDIVLFLGFDGRIVEANLAAEKAYGYDRDELLALNIRDLKPTRDRPMVADIIDGLRQEGILFETTHQRKDGSELAVEVHAGSAAWNGEPLILAVIRDITERRHAEADLERSLEVAKRESRRAAALQGIAEAGLSTLRLPDLLDTLVERIAEVLDADASCLFVLDEKTGLFEAHAAHNVPGLVGHRVSAGEGLIGRVVMERRPIYVQDAEHDPLSMDDPYVVGAKALLGVPLMTRGKVIGVTRIQSLVAREFEEDEIRLLQAIAENVAVSIDNACLYDDLQHSRNEVQEALDRETHFSLLLQRALLPDAPTMPEGYDVAVHYVPAFAGREIGGDFYDVFRASDGWTGVLVGDVSGKGLEAASLAATTRSTIHAFIHEVVDTSEALSRANSVLYGQQPAVESFVTVSLATIELATGYVRHSSAGHPPAAVLRADGSVEFLRLADVPIGVLPAYGYAMISTRLDPGDKLILYTDGISEARTDARMLGIDGIGRTLAGHADWCVQEVTRRLVTEATAWAGGKLSDDAAIVVVARASE